MNIKTLTCILIKNWFYTVSYLKQIYLEKWLSAWLLAVKVIIDKGRTKCLWISKGRKSETMAHKNKVEIFSRHNKPEWIILLRRLKSSLEKDALSAGLNMTFYPKPPPLTHRRLKQYQRTKINKTMLSPPSSVFHTKFTISELESK